MPNTAISVGKSMTCICSNELGKKRVDLAKAIFNRMGHTMEIPEEQMQAATVICASAASLLIESGSHPEEEIDRVTTPKGCTIEGLNEMEHQGLSSSLIRGIVSSFEKISQIRKG